MRLSVLFEITAIGTDDFLSRDLFWLTEPDGIKKVRAASSTITATLVAPFGGLSDRKNTVVFIYQNA